MSYPPIDLLKTLLETETSENDRLIEIISMVKPSKGTKSTFNSIIRGLFTKNTKLLTLLNDAIAQIEAPSSASSDTEVFKNFINNFILWIDNDGFTILEKYLAQIPTPSVPSPSALTAANDASLARNETNKFGHPILHCSDYVEFIQYSLETSYLRNPFVVDRLTEIQHRLQSLVDSYKNLQVEQNLNDIGFDDVKVAYDEENHRSSRYIRNPSNVGAYQKVSSFFKIDQIVHRSKNDDIYMKTSSPPTTPTASSFAQSLPSSSSSGPVELVFLNLSGDKAVDFDALALLTRPKEKNLTRSLMFPPFRVNELLLQFDPHANEIELTVIQFASSSPIKSQNSKSIIIGGGSNLTSYYKKLRTIFPDTNGVDLRRPVLIQSKSNVSSSGLGIAVINSNEETSPKSYVYEPPVNATSSKFKDLVETPTQLPLTKLQQHFKPPSQIEEQKMNSFPSATSLLLDEYEGDDDDDEFDDNDKSIFNDDEKLALNLLPPSFGTLRELTGSAVSITSSFEKPIISLRKSSASESLKNKNIAHVSNSDPVVKEIKRNTLDLESASGSSKSPCDERPVSFQAEIVNESGLNSPEQTPIPFQTLTAARAQAPSITPKALPNYNANQDKFSSVPNLTEQKPKSSIYELNSGSAIDIANFGKGYNPSFSIPKDLNTYLEEDDEQLKPPKKSFFGFFKKNKSSPKVNTKSVEMEPGFVLETSKNVKSLAIKTDLECNESAPPTGDSILTQNSVEKRLSTKPPAPFALPSSTSMNFGKLASTTSVNMKNNNSSTNLLPEEETLVVPQDLKDVINDNDSIDFFITPSLPKAMKVSKWKQKYGKWEMLTVNEMVYMKIVVNYNLNKAWLIFFKEEKDEVDPNEVYDVPILLLDVLDESITTKKTSALDFHVTSVNSITRDIMTIIVRCNNGNLLNSMNTNVDNIMGVLGYKILPPSRSATSASIGLQLPASVAPSTTNAPKSILSTSTITSSVMDQRHNQQQVNHSSTFSSINSVGGDKFSPSSFPNPTNSSYAIDQIVDYDHSSILNNPSNQKLLLLNNMKIRLQKNLENYSQVHNPSSWKILSMNTLRVYMISDVVTNTTYYNLVIEGGDNFSWLINKEDKFNTIEKIGKAGMVLKLSEEEVFLIECKGKKEFKALFELF